MIGMQFAYERRGGSGGEGESDYKVQRDNLHTITISRATQQRNAVGTIAHGQDM